MSIYYQCNGSNRMKRISVILFSILIVVMATATFMGQSHDMTYASNHVYGTWWFASLWGVAAVTGFIYAAKHFGKRPVLWLLHLSLILILAGALLTEITAKHGTLHLAQGDNMEMFVLNNRYSSIVDMPINIRLNSFDIKYYSGSQMPSDYVSHVTVTDKSDGHSFNQDISMNHILSYDNYRFYQMSYDIDDNSSTLAVNYDPYGIPVSYAGYYLLFFSSIWILFDRRCGFQMKLSKLSAKQRKYFLLSLLLVAFIAIVSVVFMVGNKTYLMPVLRSRLLYVHVSSLMIAYLFMAFIFIIAVTALIRQVLHRSINRLTLYSRIILYPSVSMMGIGIFLGAIWANVSWGNYWSWDPKETWALIAFLVYAAGIHIQSLKPMRNDVFYNTYMIFTFIILLMTYLGVNYYLSGMHSYA
jgi:ABC-type transport system involved in cytochrome c biogenesis permease subunit